MNTKKPLKNFALAVALITIFSVFLIFAQAADTAVSAAELAGKIFGVIFIALLSFFGVFIFR